MEAVGRVLAAGLLLTAGAAAAHHRQTPPIVPLALSGNTDLPRLPAFDGEIPIVTPLGDDRVAISTVRLYPDPTEEFFAHDGDNANPAVSLNGGAVAWDSTSDPLGSGDPGRQVFVKVGETMTQVSHDPSGTSANPAVSGNGTVVAFESEGDLAGIANDGVRQIYVYRTLAQTVSQATVGAGTSRNPSLDKWGKLLAYQSPTDPTTGGDTGVDQIWIANLAAGGAERVTTGQGPSRGPIMSGDGKLVVFESTADLTGSLADTTIPQVYAYHLKTRSLARITNDAGGCTLPSIHKFRSDWRIAYMCGGEAYFSLLRANERRRIAFASPGSVTTRVVAQNGPQFLVVSTTANLLNGTVEPDQMIFHLNLFYLESYPGLGSVSIEPAPSEIVWFPVQGVPPLK